MWLLSCPSIPSLIDRIPGANPTLPLHHAQNPKSVSLHDLRLPRTLRITSGRWNFTPCLVDWPKPPPDLLRKLAVCAIFLGFGIRTLSASASTRISPLVSVDCATVVQEQKIEDDDNDDLGDLVNMENFDDKEMKAAFESWKSKTYALTVPLRVFALHDSIPPSWIKEFLQSQGKRLRLIPEFCGNLEGIFSKISVPFEFRGNISSRSAVAADIVTVGDSWLSFAIKKALIEPIEGVEDHDWFKSLSDKWKVYLRRSNEGNIDSEGRIWAAPYRWGSMVIAYRKSKFQKHKLSPIEDWADLWRPELAGKISMVDSPREVIGAVLKYMGASYNTKNMDSQVAGGRYAVQKQLELLRNQVRLFDSALYLKAFGAGDVWVAVGWSSDVLPAAKLISNVAVVIPKSGASLWADLWAIPAASKFATRIGGRVRGPSPLVHQWIEFCLQVSRVLPFEKEVIPGASPSALESPPVEDPEILTKGKPKLDTNLIASVPPAEILAKCEFLEPLSDAAMEDYLWLMASIQEPSHGLIHGALHLLTSVLKPFGQRCSQR